jgi:two-component system cell cycle sensor histidine kinase/response regulator CckA
MMPPSSPNPTRRVIEIAGIALLYYGAASLGLPLAWGNTNASPVWPSAGIAFAAVLWLGSRVWPGVAVGAFLANVETFLRNQAADPGTILATSAVISVGNTLEAVGGAYLLRRIAGSNGLFDRAPDVFKFVAAALVACVVSASIGATTVSLAGLASPARYPTVWFTWWLGDVVGVLVVTPLLLAWCYRPPRSWRPRQALEAAVLFGGLVLASQLGFGGWPLPKDAHYPLGFLPIPFLVWAAFRFGPREAATAAAVTAGIAVWDTMYGFGPFVGTTVQGSLLFLQAFVGVLAATILAMAAVVAERQDAQATLRRARDELEGRVTERTQELLRLTETLRADITERRQSEEALRVSEAQLVQAQKMEAVGQLAGGIAHDFNNLLTVIGGRSALLLQRGGFSDAVRTDVELIGKTADRAAALTRQLLAFSRKQVLEPRPVEPNALVGGVAPMLRRLIGEHIELVIVAGRDVGHVMADPGQVEQVIMNLVVNARDAMPDGGMVKIETAGRDLPEAARHAQGHVPPGQYVTLSVQDAGSGMDTATLARIFEPFFTTKEPGKGTGLGLSTVHGIVHQSGGYIGVDSAPGRGTTFTIYLPRIAAGAVITDAAPPAPSGAMRGTETVLLVEDEEEVRRLASEILTGCGYTVLETGDPLEALTMAERRSGAVDLLVTDMVMPAMGGSELAERLTITCRGMRVLYISGYTDEMITQAGTSGSGRAFLHKPFTPHDLTRKVREVLTRA